MEIKFNLSLTRAEASRLVYALSDNMGPDDWELEVIDRILEELREFLNDTMEK